MKYTLILVATCILMVGCVHITINADDMKDNGPVVTRTMSLENRWHGLEVSHAFDVTMSDTASVATVSLDSALMDKLVFIVEKGTLRIGLKPGIHGTMSRASVTLPMNPALDDIELSGASTFYADSPLSAKEISIEMSGASHVKADVRVAQKVDIEAGGASHYEGSVQQVAVLDVDLSGASTAVVGGSVDVMEMDVSGASDLMAGDLDAATVKGDVSGASTVNVLCCEKIAVDVSGASLLSYGTVADGCSPVVSCNSSGTSTVTRR